MSMRAMAEYRFYVLNEAGHISAAPLTQECLDDQEALHVAGRIIATRSIEIWQGTRKVALLNPPKLSGKIISFVSGREQDQDGDRDRQRFKHRPLP
jgi:hypothetical protein